jgi:hypothetical protein
MLFAIKILKRLKRLIDVGLYNTSEAGRLRFSSLIRFRSTARFQQLDLNEPVFFQLQSFKMDHSRDERFSAALMAVNDELIRAKTPLL